MPTARISEGGGVSSGKQAMRVEETGSEAMLVARYDAEVCG